MLSLKSRVAELSMRERERESKGMQTEKEKGRVRQKGKRREKERQREKRERREGEKERWGRAHQNAFRLSNLSTQTRQQLFSANSTARNNFRGQDTKQLNYGFRCTNPAGFLLALETLKLQ